MMKNETMLHDEIKAELEELSKLEVGSDKYEQQLTASAN